MSKLKIIGWIIGVTIIALPFVAGNVNYPQSFSPQELAKFVASWLNYWIVFAKTLGCKIVEVLK